MVCTVDRIAVLKILLHSAKYPSSSVNGLLLGTSSADAPSQASESSTHVGQLTVHVTDAIPLLHSFLTLAPSMETALLQVSPIHEIPRATRKVSWHHGAESATGGITIALV